MPVNEADRYHVYVPSAPPTVNEGGLGLRPNPFGLDISAAAGLTTNWDLAWGPPLFNLPKLAYGDPIVISVHGFLGTNETVNFKNPAMAERQFHFNALLQNGVKISDAKDFTQAVQDAPIGFQVQVLQPGALLPC